MNERQQQALVNIFFFLVILALVLMLASSSTNKDNLKKSHWVDTMDYELTIFWLSKGKILPSFRFPLSLQRTIYRKLLLINQADDWEKALQPIIDGIISNASYGWKNFIFRLDPFYSLRLTYWKSGEKRIALVENYQLGRPFGIIIKSPRPLNEREGEILTIHPGEVLREDFLPAFNPQKTVEDWAEFMKVDPQKLRNFLRGEEEIDGDLITSLSICFSVSMKFWVGLDNHYYLSRQAIYCERNEKEFQEEPDAGSEAEKEENN